ncbi:MAG: TatD family hydrolase [Clostridia bacterium]|nr:TatD family hydrolase [Clostridia bacterium]
MFDTHAHLGDPALLPQLAAIVDRAGAAGVTKINTVGYDLPSSLLALDIAAQYAGTVYATVGVHPAEADKIGVDDLAQLFKLARQPQVVAWGEIGLDYHYDDGPERAVQQQLFRAQIALARESGLPIVIHDRDAHQDVLAILKEEGATENGGVMHCFSGSWETAKAAMSLGMMISFAGPLTFTNARQPVEVAAKVPLDMLLIETDCPYLSPHPFRGKTNEPARVVHTAAKLAEIKGLEYRRIEEITTENARRLFRLGEDD